VGRTRRGTAVGRQNSPETLGAPVSLCARRSHLSFRSALRPASAAALPQNRHRFGDEVELSLHLHQSGPVCSGFGGVIRRKGECARWENTAFDIISCRDINPPGRLSAFVFPAKTSSAENVYWNGRTLWRRERWYFLGVDSAKAKTAQIDTSLSALQSGPV
jgi:hypothetical protein